MALPDNPITRKEAYLAKIAGQNVQIPDTPITREEAYLNQIAREGTGTKVIANPDDVAEDVLHKIEIDGEVYSVPSGGGGGGTDDYLDLDNKPQVNGVELSGNKTTSDLGINVPTKLADLDSDSTHRTVTDTEKATWNGKSDFSGNYADLSNKPENANTFQGTIAEWNQLTTAEKKAYDHASIPDSLDGGVTFPANKVVMTGGGNVEDAIGNVAEKITELIPDTMLLTYYSATSLRGAPSTVPTGCSIDRIFVCPPTYGAETLKGSFFLYNQTTGELMLWGSGFTSSDIIRVYFYWIR